MSEAAQLAERLVALLFADDEIPADQIPMVALAVCQFTPVLKSAPEAETQYIFHELCGALAARSLARIVAKSARWIA
jgi:hypothetical protein